MAGNVVFVTSIDYVTIYPGPTSATHSTLLTSTRISTSSQSTSTLSTTISTPEPHAGMSMSSTMSSTSLLPSGTADPMVKPKVWDDSFAKLTLAAMISFAVFLLAFVLYAFYLRFRGDCPKCKSMAARLDKWEKGELKVITKDMVKQRDSLNSQTSNPPASDPERQIPETTKKPTIWSRAKCAFKAKAKRPTPPRSESKASADRLFTVAPEAVAPPRIPSPAYQQPINADMEHMYSPPSPSIYSAYRRSNIGQAYEAHPMPSHSHAPYVTEAHSTNSESLYDPEVRRKVAEETLARLTATESQYNLPLHGHAGASTYANKRRSRAYGGLPHPESFADVDLGDGLGGRR